MYFSYVVTRDYGFAPNPFHGFCTLATCKPGIRNSAKVNDWIFGCGSIALKNSEKLIYAMLVSEKINYNDYYLSNKFACKKPIMNGSLKKMYGDNIYFFDDKADMWRQRNSHHSNEDGSINFYNLKRDTGSKFVLIAEIFYYWGRKAISLSKMYNEIIYKGRGFKSININPAIAKQFIQWLKDNFEPGYLGDPVQFEGKFRWYNGK